jgi:hypothetical protein
MRISARGNLIVETTVPGVRVMRFARPDPRPYLDDDGDAATSPLFGEIQDVALSKMPENSTLIVNMGLIDPINAAFYRCLLGIRQGVRARHGRLILCGLSPRHQEVFDLFRGPLLFTIVRTEAEAHRLARGWLSHPETTQDARTPVAARKAAAVSEGEDSSVAAPTPWYLMNAPVWSTRGSSTREKY